MKQIQRGYVIRNEPRTKGTLCSFNADCNLSLHNNLLRIIPNRNDRHSTKHIIFLHIYGWSEFV